MSGEIPGWLMVLINHLFSSGGVRPSGGRWGGVLGRRVVVVVVGGGKEKVRGLVEWEERHQAFNLNKLIDFLLSAAALSRTSFCCCC